VPKLPVPRRVGVDEPRPSQRFQDWLNLQRQDLADPRLSNAPLRRWPTMTKSTDFSSSFSSCPAGSPDAFSTAASTIDLGSRNHSWLRSARLQGKNALPAKWGSRFAPPARGYRLLCSAGYALVPRATCHTKADQCRPDRLLTGAGAEGPFLDSGQRDRIDPGPFYAVLPVGSRERSDRACQTQNMVTSDRSGFEGRQGRIPVKGDPLYWGETV
jgi:hypothetical protein